MNHQKTTGVFLLLILISIVGTWFILLTYANPVNVTWESNFNYFMSPEGGMEIVFYSSIFSAIISTSLAMLLFSNKAKTKKALLIVLTLCTFQALPAIIWLDWHFKLLFSASVFYSYLAYKDPNNKIKSFASLIGTRKKPRAPY